MIFAIASAILIIGTPLLFDFYNAKKLRDGQKKAVDNAVKSARKVAKAHFNRNGGGF